MPTKLRAISKTFDDKIPVSLAFLVLMLNLLRMLQQFNRIGDCPKRSRHLFVPIVALCIGIVLHILGASVSFWDLNAASDLVESSLLEGFTLISDEAPWSPQFCSVVLSSMTSSNYRLVVSNVFFHPPLLIV